MSERFLHRSDAPFAPAVWTAIDDAVAAAAKNTLCARRVLHIEGPYGLGLKSLPGADAPIGEAGPGVSMEAARDIPLAVIRGGFSLSARDVASFEATGQPFNLQPIFEAAMACAAQEDALIFNGAKALGTDGLLTAKGVSAMKLQSWSEIGAAADDLIQAVTKLDDAGFHGPCILALAPARFNLLFRRYTQGNMTEIEHVRTVVTAGIVKAPGLKTEGVLLADGSAFATIALGQDMAAGYIGPGNGTYELTISETVALRLRVPSAVCVLK